MAYAYIQLTIRFDPEISNQSILVQLYGASGVFLCKNPQKNHNPNKYANVPFTALAMFCLASSDGSWILNTVLQIKIELQKNRVRILNYHICVFQKPKKSISIDREANDMHTITLSHNSNILFLSSIIVLRAIAPNPTDTSAASSRSKFSEHP